MFINHFCISNIVLDPVGCYEEKVEMIPSSVNNKLVEINKRKTS